MQLSSLPSLSTKRLEALRSIGIHSIEQLLTFFPRRYLDRSNVQTIKNLLGSGEEITVSGKIISIDEVGFGKKKRLEISINDGTGILKGVWFRGASYFKRSFKTGQTVAFFGAAKRFGKSITIAHPEVDTLAEQEDLAGFSRIIAVYPGSKELSKARITSSLISSWIQHILGATEFSEFLPTPILQDYNYPERHLAFRMIHFPDHHIDHKKALERFKFEEFFLFELSMENIRSKQAERQRGHLFERFEPNTATFFNSLIPFQLTEGQKTALSEIKKDLRSGRQMNRLIQGDVGAGKTVVALGAILMAIDNGFQTAFVAPTEILAEQHIHTLNEQLEGLNISIRLLVGGQKTALRRDILTDIEGGNCHIVVGTHAVLQETVQFHNLGLAVIDEQHRFGVKQRAELLNKGSHPHILVMSATPIPRSLAMTVYADLDISIIQGLPSGRKPVVTAVRSERKREDVYQFVESELTEGGQIYIVFPLIEESEAMDLKDATAGFELIKKRFPGVQTGLLHGRMPSDEKEQIMTAFKKNELQILVSTTVIEVGVDVPNASVMIIEHAERFGLSQLHQLRGRIGRGTRQSYCILLPDVKVSKAGAYRLKTMEETNDGFRIAEADLQLRGPGDFLGTKQSGLPDFKFGDIVEDQFLLAQAKETASELMLNDPELQKKENKYLKAVFEPYLKDKIHFYEMS
jgi:ATP-dependent DNA helicase RecG